MAWTATAVQSLQRTGRQFTHRSSFNHHNIQNPKDMFQPSSMTDLGKQIKLAAALSCFGQNVKILVVRRVQQLQQHSRLQRTSLPLPLSRKMDLYLNAICLLAKTKFVHLWLTTEPHIDLQVYSTWLYMLFFWLAPTRHYKPPTSNKNKIKKLGLVLHGCSSPPIHINSQLNFATIIN